MSVNVQEALGLNEKTQEIVPFIRIRTRTFGEVHEELKTLPNTPPFYFKFAQMLAPGGQDILYSYYDFAEDAKLPENLEDPNLRGMLVKDYWANHPFGKSKEVFEDMNWQLQKEANTNIQKAIKSKAIALEANRLKEEALEEKAKAEEATAKANKLAEEATAKLNAIMAEINAVKKEADKVSENIGEDNE